MYKHSNEAHINKYTWNLLYFVSIVLLSSRTSFRPFVEGKYQLVVDVLRKPMHVTELDRTSQILIQPNVNSKHRHIIMSNNLINPRSSKGVWTNNISLEVQITSFHAVKKSYHKADLSSTRLVECYSLYHYTDFTCSCLQNWFS